MNVKTSAYLHCGFNEAQIVPSTSQVLGNLNVAQLAAVVRQPLEEGDEDARGPCALHSREIYGSRGHGSHNACVGGGGGSDT